MSSNYGKDAPTRDEVEALEGPAVLEFGTDWCGHCRAAAPVIAEGFEQQPDVPHIRVEDGKGRRLGRSFGVKLWPTLIFLRDGQEHVRLVRPRDGRSVAEALERITTFAKGD